MDLSVSSIIIETVSDILSFQGLCHGQPGYVAAADGGHGGW